MEVAVEEAGDGFGEFLLADDGLDAGDGRSSVMLKRYCGGPGVLVHWWSWRLISSE